MTTDEIARTVAEIDRRFRERTPATRVDEALASYRVGRGEIRRWCSEEGIHLDEFSEEFQLASLRMYVKLRREFPDERWEPISGPTLDLARQHKIRIPRVKRVDHGP